ncbi:ribonuclease domain-containing protein [Umezawaea tangerina]|uniref:Guanyl-specific ribonuclease Sa n=1 Tax=Umezawaea tangerina TaxID=84725 RepID=A0A2T0SS08_9PSEU|nr:ribonuclease domain-containing protein [Umezawaea tangerina]PRY36163.1 guanyl-specific ribonuclease Sa [Umezawaea tangerina]
MTPGRRLSVALIGLIALVVFGWVFKDLTSSSTPSSGPTSSSAKPAAPGKSTSAAPGGAVAGTESGLDVKPLSSLPSQAADTWKLIEKNGPFPYPRNDGVEFQNREKRLPAKAGDYYKEYTVPTPGSPDRGARRLITGGQREVYYTGDHYDSFVVVDVRK